MKRRDLTAEELALWQRAMRNTSPLPGRDPQTPPSATTALPATDARPERAKPRPENGSDETAPKSARRAPPPHEPSGLDAASQRRLRRGRTEIDGRVDLHGMRQSEAHGVLTRFIAQSQVAGRRCVLVITGKGGRVPDSGDADFMKREKEGVLRRQVPLWLRQEPNASRVFAIEPAHVRHGGSGAFYVFLRKAQKGKS